MVGFSKNIAISGPTKAEVGADKLHNCYCIIGLSLSPIPSLGQKALFEVNAHLI